MVPSKLKLPAIQNSGIRIYYNVFDDTVYIHKIITMVTTNISYTLNTYSTHDSYILNRMVATMIKNMSRAGTNAQIAHFIMFGHYTTV